MFLQPVAKRWIGSLLCCVRKDWCISCVSRRNPRTTITTRRSRRSSIPCASPNSGKNKRRVAEIAVAPGDREGNARTILNNGKGVPTEGALLFWPACERQLIPAVAAKEERQNGGVLFLYGLKSARIDAQRFQDRRRDLRCGNRSLHHFGTQARVRDDEPHVGVAKAESSVLGIFLGRTRVGRPIDRLHQDIGRGVVGQRIVELE